ncbi:MAG: histidinol-phosphate transaminase [Gammaproteobacteria bacterium]|nr:histidinol-phosphate transaminase [Gammaproteobacteria bacterium]
MISYYLSPIKGCLMDSFVKDLIHPMVLNLEPYLPGKSIAEIQEKYQISEVIKLASNENCLGCSPKVLDYFHGISMQDIHLYPAVYMHPLHQHLANFLNIDPHQLMLANGSDTLFSLIIQAFILPQGKKILTHELAFMGYEKQASTYGIDTIKAKVCPKDWRLDVSDLIQLASDDVGAIFIANPNNPTGNALNWASIYQILDNIPKTTLFVLDEAYYEYHDTDNPDDASLIRRYPNLIITRTFSKAYGLASLRLGYAFANPELIQILRRIQLPFSIGLPSLNAALIALHDQDFIHQTQSHNRQQKTFLYQELQSFPFRCHQSAANFITIEQQQDIMPLVQFLESKGVIIRPLHAFGLKHAARITIGTAQENKILLTNLQYYFEEQ